jgi:hypothetical protein
MWEPSELPMMHCPMPSRRKLPFSKTSDLKKMLKNQNDNCADTYCKTKKEEKLNPFLTPQ